MAQWYTMTVCEWWRGVRQRELCRQLVKSVKRSLTGVVYPAGTVSCQRRKLSHPRPHPEQTRTQTSVKNTEDRTVQYDTGDAATYAGLALFNNSVSDINHCLHQLDHEVRLKQSTHKVWCAIAGSTHVSRPSKLTAHSSERGVAFVMCTVQMRAVECKRLKAESRNDLFDWRSLILMNHLHHQDKKGKLRIQDVGMQMFLWLRHQKIHDEVQTNRNKKATYLVVSRSLLCLSFVVIYLLNLNKPLYSN